MKAILVMSYAYHYRPEEWDELVKAHDYKLVIGRPKTQQEFLQYFQDDDIEIVINTWPDARAMGGYSKELIKKLKLKAIVHQGAGYDVLGDITTWKASGTQVANAPTYVAPSTADTAVFLTLGAARKFNRLSTSLRAKKWLGTLPVEECHDPEGLVVTIIGMGNIGRMIKDRLRPFGYKKIQYSNRKRAPADLEAGAQFVDLETAWRTSNVLIFACPLNASTHHLLNKETISKCKDGVIIVNIARGGVIDEQSLVDALASGKVASAGLDVFEHEPEVHPELLKNEDVFLLPHAATHSLETRHNVEGELIANAKSFMETGQLITLVPEMHS